MNKPTLLIGAPGTGKTHRLVEKIIELKPDKFALVSFTRRAAREAKDRLRAYYKESELKYVRTIHSLCFELLGLRSNQVLQFNHLRQFGNEYGYDFNFRSKAQEDDTFNFFSEDDIEYQQMMIKIAKLQTIDMGDMWLKYVQWKISKGFFDYNDMIERSLQESTPSFDLLLVDEIQDLTPLQLEFVSQLTKNAQQVIYAGDDNQMIFEWAGVDREKFIELGNKCQIESLIINHRITGHIALLARQTVRKQSGWHTDQYITEYIKTIPDNIEYISTEPIEFNKKESWLILARNSYLLGRIAQGLDYLSENWDWLSEESKPGSIKLSTIHGAKGAEADNVILLTDVSPATYEQLDNDSEHRVWYVAVTRARKKLWIVQPQTDLYYDIF